MVFRKLSKMLIKKLGIIDEDILLFKNGKEIYDYILKNIKTPQSLPKILFLDLNMPVMNGWEFLELCHLFTIEHNYYPIIYILTSSVNPKDYDNAKNLGNVKGYLIKPINIDTITKIIKT